VSIKKSEFLKDNDVKQFIEFLAEVIVGSRPVKHEYWDQKLAGRKKEPEKKAHRCFTTLKKAFDEYYWPQYKTKFDHNLDILKPLRDQIATATTREAAYYATSRILWWGAGNSGQTLYSGNMSWLNKKIDNGSSTLEILNDADKLFSADPFDGSPFDGNAHRSNAGFTKVYALRFEEFIIYDSRVAAALGLLVAQYCEQRGYNKVPSKLELGWSQAKYKRTGEKEPLDNRNPSRGTLKFREIGSNDHDLHAQSNWRANIFLSKAISSLEKQNRKPDWLSSCDQLRRVEAALFMLGKDIPKDRRKFPAGVKLKWPGMLKSP